MRQYACFIKPLPGEVTEARIPLPPDGQGMLSGIVHDHENQPVHNALVLLLSSETGETLDHTITDDHGRFWFGPLEAGIIYGLHVQKKDSSQRLVEFTL